MNDGGDVEPGHGCTKISAGCKNCYAERMSLRLRRWQTHYVGGFSSRFTTTRSASPAVEIPRLIFVNSMSDLFQQDVPLEFIQQVFDVMVLVLQHTFQILTNVRR